VTVVEECDFTSYGSTRRTVVCAVRYQGGDLGLTAFPEFNATLDGEDIDLLRPVRHRRRCAGAKGLVVPVLHGADSKSLTELNLEVNRLAQVVRDGYVVLRTSEGERSRSRSQEARRVLCHAAGQPWRSRDPWRAPDLPKAGGPRW